MASQFIYAVSHFIFGGSNPTIGELRFSLAHVAGKLFYSYAN